MKFDGRRLTMRWLLIAGFNTERVDTE